MLASGWTRPTLNLRARELLMRSVKTFELITAVALIMPGARLVAQQPTASPPAAPAKTGKAEIAGVVVDSLHGGYLRGADVIIEGTNANTVTDSAGRFAFEGLPPGTYRVGVFHPLLDTLGISLATKPFHASGDSTNIAILGVPSAATLIRTACSGRSGGQDNSAVIGHVNESETLRPISGAEVSIAWIELEVSKEVGVRQTPHVMSDTTNAAGAFEICGLPNSMDATLKARKGMAVTSEIPITLGDSPSELFARTLALSLADSGVKVGTAAVSGRVVLEGSSTNAGSRVELVGTSVVVLTNDKGEFSMTNLPSGSQVLLARHIGYGAATASVDLSAREPRTVTITLPKFVALMDPVLVTARRNVILDAVGFNQRKKAGNGYFVGPERIASIHPNSVNDIFRQVPGLRVEYSGMHSSVRQRRGVDSFRNLPPCVRYFLDGVPWLTTTPGDIEGFVNGNEVVAVEVYNSATVPARYMGGMGNCITALIWTHFKMLELKEK
jgi:carboxypeptidase family protein